MQSLIYRLVVQSQLPSVFRQFLRWSRILRPCKIVHTINILIFNVHTGYISICLNRVLRYFNIYTPTETYVNKRQIAVLYYSHLLVQTRSNIVLLSYFFFAELMSWSYTSYDMIQIMITTYIMQNTELNFEVHILRFCNVDRYVYFIEILVYP